MSFIALPFYNFCRSPMLMILKAGHKRDAKLNYRQVRKLQTGLVEIAESIEMVKQDHDKLERQNLALQDYIGGLTRSMSKNDIGASKGKK